jgi:hypothetical protein
MKTVYIAGKYLDRLVIKEIADKIKQKGFEVTAEWYNDTEIPKEQDKDWYLNPEVYSRFIRDFLAVEKSDIFILYLGDGMYVCGAYIELGMAFVFDYDDNVRMKKIFQKAVRKRFILIGKPVNESVLLYPVTEKYETVDQMLEKL